MGRRTVVGLGGLIIAALLLCPISQMFDHWDHSETKGKDTETSLMLIAECAGAAIAILHSAAIVSPNFARTKPRVILFASSLRRSSSRLPAIQIPESPPPLPLRI